MLDKDIARYSQSFMSNAKWRKLFQVVNNESLELGVCVWKLVSEATPIRGYLPACDVLGPDYVGDCGALNGPFEFRVIEWLEIPASHGYRPYENAPLKTFTQDLAAVAARIDAVGAFEYEMVADGLRIYGYKP